MVDLMQNVRVSRTVPVAHAEAFQLMLYTSEEDAAPVVWVWNSRDGVTPFGARFHGKEYRHAMNSYAATYSAVLPPKAEFVWVSYTPASWEAMERRNYQRFAEAPDDKPYGGAEFRARHPTVEDWLAVVPFEHGKPRSLTVAEFLDQTPEWMGNFR